MKTKKILALILSAVLVLSSVASVFAEDEQSEYSNNMLKTIVKVYAHQIADNYYYGIDDEELLFKVICQTIDDGKFSLDSAIKAMIEALGDEHAEFYTKEEYKQMTEELSGNFAGIGVVMMKNSRGVVVTDVYDNTPAMRAGILKGDYIIKVDGLSVEGAEIDEIKKLVTGEEKTNVKLTLLRGESVVEVLCVREIIDVKHISTKMLTDSIAYLGIDMFAANVDDDVKSYVSDLQRKGVKKLVIDLRDNPGGDLDAALGVAQTFISAGKLAQLRYKDSEKNKYLYSENLNAPKMDIAVLVNENSASASEFLATAFKGRGAAKIIGTKTYGKGSMQAMFGVITGAGIKYTMGEFFSIKGDRVHKTGITPDIAVENEYKRVNEDEFEKIDMFSAAAGEENGRMNLALEQRLNVLGLFDGKIDEIFDEETASAVAELQTMLGTPVTGKPSFNEYMYLNDLSYDFETVNDLQLSSAIEYLDKR